MLTGAVAVALAIIALAGKILLFMGDFRPGPVTVAAACASAAAGIGLLASRPARRRAAETLRMLRVSASWPGLAPAAVAAAGAAAAGGIGYATAAAARQPATAYSAAYYHLVPVADWLRTGHFSATLLVPASHGGTPTLTVQYLTAAANAFPKDGEIIAAWFGVLSRSVSTTAIAQAVFLPMLLGGMYGICRHLNIRPAFAAMAAGFVTLVPAVLTELGTSYVSVQEAAALVAAFQFIVSAFPAVLTDEEPTAPKARSLVLAGVCLALAAGITPSGLMYCLAAVLLTIGLCVRDNRYRLRSTGPLITEEPALPRLDWCLIALSAPVLALGTFWYARSWLTFGSPVWPMEIGPFAGPASVSTLASVNSVLPLRLADDSGMTLIARSWLMPHYSLGDIWLFLLLPAIAAAVFISVRRHRLMPVIAVIAPLFILDAMAPGAWQSQAEIPLVAAAAIALALACEALVSDRRSWLPARSTGRRRRPAGQPLAAAGRTGYRVRVASAGRHAGR